MESGHAARPHRIVGRYAICDEFASGGMATVHFARLLGSAGFSRTVAVKCLHPQFARDQNFVSMFLDEARLAARINDPHVVPILDVVSAEEDLFLVMEYVHGESLSGLIRHARRAAKTIPPPIAVSLIVGTLRGLQAAHEAKDEAGHPLGIIHRDVSPQNVMVGIDGLARVTDFGIAKAAGRLQSTNDGQLKGKLNYMAPEQYAATEIDQRVDVYAAAVVLWELLTGGRLFDGDRPAAIMNAVLTAKLQPPSSGFPDVPAEIDAIVMRGLARDPEDRFATAREMAEALERALPLPTEGDIGAWVKRTAAQSLDQRDALRKRVEAKYSVQRGPASHKEAPPTPPGVPVDEMETVDTGAGVLDDLPMPAPIATSITDLSVTTPARPPRMRIRRAAMVWTGASIGLVLAVVGTAIALRPGVSRATAGLSAPIASVIAAFSAMPVTAQSSVPELAPTPASSVDTTPAASSSTHVGTKPPAHGTAPKKLPPPTSCVPPYWIDDDGIRHPKPECLKKR